MSGRTADPLRWLTGVETAQAVRRGELSVRVVTEAALARIDADPTNAFEQILADSALREADELDRFDRLDLGELPLAGVPVAGKAEDDIAGVTTTYGGRSQATPAGVDSAIVARLRAAGAVIVATTAMPEFGQFPFTESVSHGTTHNPHDPTRSPGGSSGGSGAAVASGCVPVATGGDGGGSIRIPASACGVVGLKAMRGRVSTAPHPDLWGALGTVGVLTRTVADAAMVYDHIAGDTPVDRWRAPAWDTPLHQAIDEGPGQLTIGLATRLPFGGGSVDPEVATAAEAAADALTRLGHRVEELPRWPNTAASFLPQFLAAVRDEVAMMEHPDRVERRSAQTAGLGRLVRPGLLARAVAAGERLAEQMNHVDVVLSPHPRLPPATYRPVGRSGQLPRCTSFDAHDSVHHPRQCDGIPGDLGTGRKVERRPPDRCTTLDLPSRRTSSRRPRPPVGEQGGRAGGDPRIRERAVSAQETSLWPMSLLAAGPACRGGGLFLRGSMSGACRGAPPSADSGGSPISTRTW